MCPGHGAWRLPAPLGLEIFVSGVLQGSVRSHQVPRWSPESNADGTGFVWTTRPHVIAERAQLVATTQRRERDRSEEHTSELQSLMRISYAVVCLKKKTKKHPIIIDSITKVQIAST